MRFQKRLSCFAVLLTASIFLTSCKKSEIRIYDTPKDRTAATRTILPSNDMMEASGVVTWQKPDAWQELPPTQFRKGNFLYDAGDAGSVEITVSSFPGATGGLLANVNRWLGQAELPPVNQSQLDQMIESRILGTGIETLVVDLKPEDPSPDETRIYAATLMYGGQSWFFKMTGPSALVESQIDAFDQMVAELEFGTGPVAAALDDAALSPPDSNIVFQAPEGWTESEGSSVRIASFRIEKEGLPPADFSITSFPGDTGGNVANVNRWRRQIGLGPWSPAQVQARTQHYDSPKGLHFDIFDLKAESDAENAIVDERIIAAVVERDGRSWFFKLRGDALLLDTQRNKFDALLASVEFQQN